LVATLLALLRTRSATPSVWLLSRCWGADFEHAGSLFRGEFAAQSGAGRLTIWVADGDDLGMNISAPAPATKPTTNTPTTPRAKSDINLHSGVAPVPIEPPCCAQNNRIK
jgi:hypothetical protein